MRDIEPTPALSVKRRSVALNLIIAGTCGLAFLFLQLQNRCSPGFVFSTAFHSYSSLCYSGWPLAHAQWRDDYHRDKHAVRDFEIKPFPALLNLVGFLVILASALSLRESLRRYTLSVLFIVFTLAVVALCRYDARVVASAVSTIIVVVAAFRCARRRRDVRPKS